MKSNSAPRASYAELAKIIFLASVVTYFLVLCAQKALGQEAKPVQLKCEAYGRLVECKALNTGNHPVMMAEVQGDKPPYLAAGEQISFMTKGNAEYTIELHLEDVDGFPVLRTQAKWGRDPKDGVRKVLFWVQSTESEDSKTSPSTTKQARKEK